MSRRSLAICALLLAGCAREVTLDIHHPDRCEGVDVPQRFAAITHFETTLVRVNGTLVPIDGCQPAPVGLDGWEDLSGVVFLDSVSRPADAIEIRLEGVAGECGASDAESVLRCESFGDTVVDLELDDVVRMWCECPFR